ncbi:hypothetical protein ACFP2T_19730 [Plantactinospora solaniradicis]|uniref:CHAT domain-containing protein n=1 Tax=Plantactinospora solaniradicis TaxID=1723736 RepID=A0ABW1KDK7_9ACTN
MIKIAEEWLRVEYAGAQVPARLIIPLVFERGKHKNVRIRITPRDGVRLGTSVEAGSALQQTFTKGWTKTAGASFFGSTTIERADGATKPQYSVFLSPDFRSVVFDLLRFDTPEPIGIQIAFPVDHYDPNPTAITFATIDVEVGGASLMHAVVPQEVHPKAALVGVVAGLEESGYAGALNDRLGPFMLTAGVLNHPTSDVEVRDFIARGYDILHFECLQVDPVTIIMRNNVRISISEFFNAVDRGSIKVVVLATCNSVAAVTEFRRSNAFALVAATENLFVDYWSFFERAFYGRIAMGKSVSDAFAATRDEAAANGLTHRIALRSGPYEPMFLDLKRDVAFGAEW